VHRRNQALRELELAWRNMSAYHNYLRLQDQDIPTLVKTAIEKYFRWIDQGVNAMSRDLMDAREPTNHQPPAGAERGHLHPPDQEAEEVSEEQSRTSEDPVGTRTDSIPRSAGSIPEENSTLSGEGTPPSQPPSGEGGAGAPPLDQGDSPNTPDSPEKLAEGGKPPKGFQGFKRDKYHRKPSPRRPYIDKYGRVNYYEVEKHRPAQGNPFLAGLKTNPWGFTSREDFFWGNGAGSVPPYVEPSDSDVDNERDNPNRNRDTSRRRREQTPGESRRIRDMTTMELTDLVASGF
jgi:hypothetical protein